MSLEATAAFYDRWSRVYDRLARAPPVGRWRRRAVAALALEPGDAVLDAGCGTGANLPLLRRAVGDGRVVGVDVSRESLAVARSRDPSAALVRADAADPPVSGDVDAVLATFLVGMFADPARVVDRWCDVVGPGGRVALLNAQRATDGLVGRLTPAYDRLVAVANPGWDRDAAVHHDRRVRAAREALAARTTDRRTETYAGGFVGLAAGTVV